MVLRTKIEIASSTTRTATRARRSTAQERRSEWLDADLEIEFPSNCSGLRVISTTRQQLLLRPFISRHTGSHDVSLTHFEGFSSSQILPSNVVVTVAAAREATRLASHSQTQALVPRNSRSDKSTHEGSLYRTSKSILHAGSQSGVEGRGSTVCVCLPLAILFEEIISAVLFCL